MPRAAAFALLLCACDGVFGLQHVPGDDTAGPNIQVETVAHAHGKVVDSVTCSVDVSAPADVLVVYAAVGNFCSDLFVPDATLMFAGSSPSPFHMITGTPCNDSLSHSYAWVIANPPMGPHDVVVAVNAPAASLHAGAIVLSGVDTRSPVHAVAEGVGHGTLASVFVTSDVGDMVVSMIGQGTVISNAGAGATVRYIDNVDSATTLNNTAISTSDGMKPSVETSWTFGAIDEWQAIVLSLRAAP